MKTIQQIFFFFAALLISVSCNKQVKNIDSLFTSERALQHTEMLLADDEFLGLVFRLMAVGDNLIVHEHGREYSFSIINTNNNILSSRFARFGQGPYEVLPQLMSPGILNDSIITFFSIQRNALLYSNLKGDLLPRKKIDFDRSIGAMSMIPVSSDRYIAMGAFEGGKYALLSENGEVLSFNFDYPMPLCGANLTSPMHKFLAFQGTLQRRPDGGAFFFVAMSSEIFEIIEVDKNDNVRKVFKYHGRMAQFLPEGDGFNRTSVAIHRSSRMFFIDATATNNYIYLLYSNKIIEDGFHSARQSNQVLVFDWQGNPITRLLLDIEVSVIAVSENDEYLFAYANELEKLVRFDLR